MEENTLELNLQRCMGLCDSGGGRVVVHYNPDVFSVESSIDTNWLVEHHEALCTMTLDVPSHGAFALMHPGVLAWELDRNDFRPLEGTA